MSVNARNGTICFKDFQHHKCARVRNLYDDCRILQGAQVRAANPDGSHHPTHPNQDTSSGHPNEMSHLLAKKTRLTFQPDNVPWKNVFAPDTPRRTKLSLPINKFVMRRFRLNHTKWVQCSGLGDVLAANGKPAQYDVCRIGCTT